MTENEMCKTPKKAIPIGMYAVDADGDICIEFKWKRKGKQADYEAVKVSTLISMLATLLNHK